METSIFIARLFAIVYLFIGLGMLLNHKYYKKAMDEIMKDKTMFYFGGMLATIAGFLIVYYHNLWVKDWRVIITLFGWAALIKGFFLFVYPQHFEFWRKQLKNANIQLASVFIILIGVLMGYFGFFM